MVSIDKLRDEIAITKDDMLSGMEPAAMGPYIWNLFTDYYYSYVNNDMDKFHAAEEDLIAAIEVARNKCANATNYFNYCRISIMTALLNKLFKRDESLEMPDDDVDIDDIGTMDRRLYDELTEAIKIGMAVKRDDKDYFKNLEIEMMAEGDYVKHLIRSDVNVEYAIEHMDIIKNILSDEGMTALNYYLTGGK